MTAKVITLHSPIPKTGQTTLANLLGIALANKDKFVLLIEMSNGTGFSTILNKSIDRVFSSLKTALINPNRTPNNLLKSLHNPNFYYLTNNYENTIKEISEVNPQNIHAIIKQVINTFDYILIDLPSYPFDEATSFVLGKSNIEINHHIEVVDENIMSIKNLNDAANIFKDMQMDKELKLETTLAVNKSMGRYSRLYEGHLKGLPFFEIKNIVDIPYIREYPYLCNEGLILNLGKTKEGKELTSSVSLLGKIIEKNSNSVGMISTRKELVSEKAKNDKQSLFKKKDKTKKEKEKVKAKSKAKPKTKEKEEPIEVEVIDLD